MTRQPGAAPVQDAGSAPTGRPVTGDGTRREIQGLRALAVALVVVFHLWPGTVTGGYLGVDVFFVVSGFLIGGHLLRELTSTGTVRLTRFWARRARRLLPASFTVLAVCLVVTWLAVPAALQGRWFAEIGGAAYYGLNWLLAGTAVQYSAADLAASPAQHFWSLSVEEQFYLAWPLLLVVSGPVALVLARRGRRVSLRRRAAAVAFAVLALSFAWSVYLSPRTAAAYFVTTTRAWEFAAGALLAAVLPSLPRLPDAARRLISAGGAAVVVATAFTISAVTAFPGWVAAVPVLATAAVIAAGDPGRPGEEGAWRLLAWYRPVPLQRLGDWSYAVYLWHWPVLVLVPFVTRHVLGAGERFGVLALTLVLAPLTKRFVEDPVRRLPVRGPRDVRTTFAATAAAMAVVLVLCSVGGSSAARSVRAERAAAAAVDVSGVTCLGAAAGVTGPCDDVRVAGRVVPPAASALADSVRYCLTGNFETALSVCEFGVPLDRARHVVAIVGDSHAAMWQAAFEVVARDRGWHVYTFFKGSCQFNDTLRAAVPAVQHGCTVWNEEVQQAFRDRPQITTVIATGKVSSPFVAAPGQTSFAAGVAGYRAAWESLPSSVRDLWVIRDMPELGRDARQCLLLLPADQLAGSDRCGSPRAAALLDDPGVAAVTPLEAGAASGRRYHHVDLTDLVCTPDRCPAVIGHVVVYRDTHHLTATFARTLVPYLAERLDLDRG